jgi:hypothetical protein
MGVFWVLTPAIGTSGKNVGVVFEHPAASVHALAAQIAERGIVCGDALRMTTDARGERVVLSRKPYAVTVHGVAAISEYTLDPPLMS